MEFYFFHIFLTFLSQSFDSDTKLYITPLQEHSHTSMLVLHSCDYSQLGVKNVEKSLAQEVRQKNDISDCRSQGWKPPSTLTLFAARQLCHYATCQGSSYTKNEYSLFYQKFDAEYFFMQQFFRKSCIFRENRKKLLGGRI